MRTALLSSLMVLGLAACSQQAETPAPEAVAPATAPVAVPVAQATPELTVEQACREAARLLYGQEGAAVRFDEATFDISWPAPVDGGRLIFACSHVGSQVSLTREGERQTVDISAPADAPAQQGAH